MFNFFSRKKEAHQRPERPALRPIDLTVKHLVRETPDAVSIHFDAPEAVTYEAGQFLTLVIPYEGKEVRRAYSLSSSPFVDAEMAVTVKRVADGLVSNYLNDTLQEGDTVRALTPTGRFVTKYDAAQQRHVVMFAGGSGITPLMSLAKSVLDQEPGSVVSLIYANRTESAIIFRRQLEAMRQQYGERLNVTHVLSRPDRPWDGPCGRLDAGLACDLLDQLPTTGLPKTEYFLCGPTGMMEAVAHGLQKRGAAAENIHREHFHALPPEVAEASASEQKTRTVQISYRGEEHAVAVAPGQTILEAGLAQGIDLPYSCQSGMCTACMGRCRAGQVQMVDQEALTDEELAAGYALTCVGRPLTDDVRIEID